MTPAVDHISRKLLACATGSEMSVALSRAMDRGAGATYRGGRHAFLPDLRSHLANLQTSETANRSRARVGAALLIVQHELNR